MKAATLLILALVVLLPACERQTSGVTTTETAAEHAKRLDAELGPAQGKGD